jgi:hypothetical protein
MIEIENLKKLPANRRLAKIVNRGGLELKKPLPF